MGAWLGRRAEPRIDYFERVRVLWPGEVSGVDARALNLSAAGILIDAPSRAPCDVGSDVLCDVALPRGQVLLRGRVAHRRPLSPAKVGMGIEFIDLTPRETAELRGLVGGVDAEAQRARPPQRVKVRFEGTDQTVRARAVTTDTGLRLTTTLPFLKVGTRLEVSLAPESLPHAQGRVASVALEFDHQDGVPRLLIDVDVTDTEETPVVETLASMPEAPPEVLPEPMPERIWSPEELSAVTTVPEGAVPEGVVPAAVADSDATMVIPIEDRTELGRPSSASRRGWALAIGMFAGAVGVVLLAPTILRHVTPRSAEPPPALAPQERAPAPPALAPSAPVEAQVEAKGEPWPEKEPPEPEPAEPPSADPTATDRFTITFAGSLVGAHRYELRAPDGVAFNLPHARPTVKMGTYHSAVPGVRLVWIRPLAGGGTNVRFFFTSRRPPPVVSLGLDGATVSAR